MIDVIIPAYNATETIGKTLESRINQKNVSDLSVTIVDDCSKDSYEKICEYYSKFVKIKLIRLDINSGPGVARQIGIENSNNPFIVFIDADDEFYDENALSNLYKGVYKYYDLCIGQTYYVREDQVLYFDECLHGKIYRRRFLNENNICFNGCRNHEDNAFNELWLCTCKEINYLDESVIIYKYNNNPKSITNSIGVISNVRNFIDSMNWLFEKIEESNYKKTRHIGRTICTILTYLYHCYEKELEKCQFILTDSSFLKKEYYKYREYIDKESEIILFTNINLEKKHTFEEFLDLIK